MNLKQQGIDNAINGANNRVPNWSDTCYEYLIEYLQIVNTFLTEDFRQWCKEVKGFEAPKSSRAFGGVVVRAKENELIKFLCYTSTKNEKAHGTPASKWLVLAKAKQKAPVKRFEQMSMFL